VETAQFEPNFIWVAWSALDFVSSSFLWAVAWTVRRLRSVSAFERRVSDLVARIDAREKPPGGRLTATRGPFRAPALAVAV
jgi:hypothetical protein